MIRTITKYHVHEVINKETKEITDEIELPKNTYSPKAAKKILEKRGFDSSNYVLVYKNTVREKRELSDEDFIKYSKLVD